MIRKKNNHPIKAYLVIAIFLIITVVSAISRIKLHFTGSSVLGDQTPGQNNENSRNVFSQNLYMKLKTTIDAAQGTYTIYISDINSNQSMGINDKTVLTAASINKVPILAVLYYQANKKNLDLEKIIIPQPSDIQDYGTGSIRYDPTGIPYSLKSLARLMMEKSDNTAAHILATQVLTMDQIQKTIDDWGLTQTSMTDNQSSVYDMNTLLTKMYKGETTNKALRDEMFDFMDNSDTEDRIPKLLPKDIHVYHKTGDDVAKLHDVGIVDIPKHPYYIGIMTSDITDEEATKKTMAELSKIVFDYMKTL